VSALHASHAVIADCQCGTILDCFAALAMTISSQ
jgi:hypothetical protein